MTRLKLFLLLGAVFVSDVQSKRKPGAISKQKCEEEYTVPEGFILGGRGAAGGKDAQKGDFPHMAALGYGPQEAVQWKCGGSLISNKFILTAAHCIKKDLKHVRLGDLNLASDDDGVTPIDRKVARTFVHPSYKPPSIYHDIALVEMDEEYRGPQFGSVTPACLQLEHQISKRAKLWLATGWGATAHNGAPSDRLQYVSLNETDRSKCSSAFGGYGKRRLLRGIDHDTQICASHDTMDTCPGDSGGPLEIQNYFVDNVNVEEGWTIIGVTSFGKECLLTNSGGVYTRVSHYIEWIESIVWPE